MVRFRSKTPTENGQNFRGRVISRAGKSTRKHRSWFNLEYIEPVNLIRQKGTLDWEKEVDRWESVPNHVDNGSSGLCATGHTDTFYEAKLKGMQNWRDIGTSTTVPDKGQDFITGRWVLTMKNGRNKARFAACGFQDSSSSTNVVLNDSLTCSKESLLVILTLISHKKWSLNSLDVKAAFLQGLDLNRDIFLKPPKEAGQQHTLWKLEKCIYGLDESSRIWYLRVKTFMIEKGLTISRHHSSVFFLRKSEELLSVICSHLDDFLWSGVPGSEKIIIEKLRHEFRIGSEETNAFMCLGVIFRLLDKTVFRSQNNFKEKIVPLENSFLDTQVADS